MDKKNVIIVVIVAIMLALIIAVFAMSSSVPKVSKDVIMTIDGNEYTIDEFRKYTYIKNEADGDISKQLTAEETDTMLNEFFKTKMYVMAADKNGITVSGDEQENFAKDYDEKSATYKKYGISKDDYEKYATDEYKKNKLSSNFSNYYTLPEEYYNDFVNNYTDDKKTYEYRIMMFSYDAPSGDVSGDVSGDASGDVDNEKLKENVLAKAQKVLEEVRNSGDFGALAKENASYRIGFKGSQYTLINGDLEYATSPIIKSKISNEDLYNAVIALSSGDTTDIIDDEESNVLYFAKLENVRDGFVGEGKDELQELLLLEYAETLIMKDVKYEMNSAAVMRALYSK